MAYCDRCGAYIPDGQEKCLACGYDPSQAASASQAREQADLERERREERRRRQEEYRRQAEEEYARRRQEEEMHRQAQEEFARRQAEEDRQKAGWQESGGYAHPYSREGEVHSSRMRRAAPRVNNRLLSAASYLGILFILPYLLAPEDRFARFHAKQGLLLFLYEALAGVIGGFFGLGWLLNLFTLYCIYKGMNAALHGRIEELPVIGKYAGRIS